MACPCTSSVTSSPYCLRPILHEVATIFIFVLQNNSHSIIIRHSQYRSTIHMDCVHPVGAYITVTSVRYASVNRQKVEQTSALVCSRKRYCKDESVGHPRTFHILTGGRKFNLSRHIVKMRCTVHRAHHDNPYESTAVTYKSCAPRKACRHEELTRKMA